MPSSPDKPQPKLKILIVDDNQQMRRMMRTYLLDLADEIRECDDGSNALPVYTEFRPDWVLMDWEMKQMDGVTAMKNILKKFPEARIVILTNYDEKDLREAAGDAGAYGYVLKDDLLTLRTRLKAQ
jgi:NarL family two-component system response regulator LiaR